jgi:hypothetical protein
LIESCGYETDDGDIDDTYETVCKLSEGKSKPLNTNKSFQFLGVSTDIKKLTPKDKKIIEYIPRHFINNVNNTLFHDMISKKKEFLNKVINSEDLKGVEFV